MIWASLILKLCSLIETETKGKIKFQASLTCKQDNVSPKNKVFPFESRQIRSKRPNTSVLLW